MQVQVARLGGIRRSAHSGRRAVHLPSGLKKKTLFCQEEKLKTGRGNSLADVLPKIEANEVHQRSYHLRTLVIGFAWAVDH